nr:TetR/AcrR family transcriptional regulator [Pseudomaricurvus alkylphenolicus]
MSSGRSKVATRTRGQQRRAEIIEAATAILLEKGHSGLVLRDVAARVGIRIGNLHYYFQNKQELLIAIFSHQSSAYVQGVKDAVSLVKGRESGLLAIFDAGLSVIKRPEAKLWKILIARAQYDPEARALFLQENQIYHQITVEALLNIDSSISETRALAIAHFVWTLLDGISLQIGLISETSEEFISVEEEARQTVKNLLRAD